nr:hypothetical protein [Pseudopedobacter sp.]
MKNKIAIQIKTSLLLLVFLLNTMVVSACSLGMDMKFNSTHHQEKISISISHHHESKAKHHEDEKDNCCKDEAVKFAKFDKLNPQASHLEINPIFHPVLLNNFSNHTILENGSDIFINKFFVLRHHPPIRDIRIAIQSFQI